MVYTEDEQNNMNHDVLILICLSCTFFYYIVQLNCLQFCVYDIFVYCPKCQVFILFCTSSTSACPLVADSKDKLGTKRDSIQITFDFTFRNGLNMKIFF